MKKVPFTKMNGAGNDFVMFDNRKGDLHFSKEEIARICDRHRGVGSDGILLVESNDPTKTPLRMRYYNSDGGEAEMCGNGARCFARFVQQLGACQDRVDFQTLAGPIHAEIQKNQIQINMGSPSGIRLHEKVPLQNSEVTLHSTNTGVPHAVMFVEDVEKVPIQAWGSEIRHHPHFAPKGTNVNFVQRLSENLIRVRTFERGVETETLACGTGVTASALISDLILNVKSPVRVRVQSGEELIVHFQREGDRFRDVRLQGPAEITFEGVLSL